MAKQQKTQQFCFKLNSSFLAKYNWDLTLPVEEARKAPGVVISLADSQILTWINELNGTEDYDIKAKEIKREIKLIKKEKNSKENKKKVKELYEKLYKLQFKEDYLCLIIDKLSDYDRANKGFKVNGIEYKRLLTTTNGVKTSTVVYTSVRLLDELKKRIENGRNTEVKLVPAKLGAYEALCSSASIPVDWPEGIIVVPDCMTIFNAETIQISEENGETNVAEPMVHEIRNNASDGCGMMLPSLSRKWNGQLGGNPEETISGCNLRCAWTKGMVFTFDYIEWAEKNVGSYIIKDVWDQERDIRESELIITESQLKLWSHYNSWEDYYNKCIDNKYRIRIAKTSDDELDDIRQLNYQFIQPHPMDDDDIKELISDTVNEIKDIMKYDYRQSIVYLCGSGLDENNVRSMDYAAQALMINRNMIDDPYISSKIRNMIQKRIRDAKIGVLDVHGNFQILSGDLVALCESMFGLEPKGVLKAGEIYSRYWADEGVKEVVCYRAPMSNFHSIQTKKISYFSDASYWFRHIKTCVVANAFDTMPMALNGFDFDGDLLFTTNNPVLLRTNYEVPALECIQKSAEKKKVEESDVIISNKGGFGSKIGQITNRITAMTSLMSNYSPEDEEYKELERRTRAGQNFQQNEIDRAKGITSTPMPKSWYDIRVIKIDPLKDSKEEIERKKLDKKICVYKKPYFFMYNYSSLYSEYNDYIKNIESKSRSMFKLPYLELKNKKNKTEEEDQFVSWAENKMPVDTSPSVMNKLCWFVEDELDSFRVQKADSFDFSILKSGARYNQTIKNEIGELYKKYKQKISDIAKRKNSKYYFEETDAEDVTDRQMLMDTFKEKCVEICPNSKELCDILVDMCYKGHASKEFAWYVCGEDIINNLLSKNNNSMYFPEKVKSDGEFDCCGHQFVMKKFKVGGDEE